MNQCLELAKLGLGKTISNPLVGCVIVNKNKVIASGYHKKFGEDHAEVNAIKNVKNKSLLQNSILYVNLEPCSHHGKTPPCVDLIIKNKIKTVVIGTLDPFNKVNGEGIKKLKQHTKVIINILKKKCLALNKQYFTNHILQRPFIILKWAESKDGFINTNSTGIKKISCDESHILTHKWRSEVDSIMVGTNTIICDNPLLTNRKSKGKSPIRITIDRNNKLKTKNFNIFNEDAETIIFHYGESKTLKNIKYLNIGNNMKLKNGQILENIMKTLYQKEISSILIEGGTTILQNLININLWDEVRTFSNTKNLKNGVKAPKINWKNERKQKVGSDLLKIMYNKYHLKNIEQSF